MKKQKINAILLSTLLLAILSTANIIIPVYAMIVPQETETYPQTFNVGGFTVRAKRIDSFQYNQHMIRIIAETEINGRKISIQSTPYPLYKVKTLEYRQPKEPRYTIMNSSSTYTVGTSLEKYVWNGIVFVRAPGNDFNYIRYDHPDNYETYYPLQVNKDYLIRGNTKDTFHLSVKLIEEAKFRSSFASIAGLLGPIISGLLLLPELTSKVVAGIIALFGAVCSLLGYTVKWFVENFVQTELNDGWAYSWGYGKFTFWIFTVIWLRMSFGSLRDWEFLIIL